MSTCRPRGGVPSSALIAPLTQRLVDALKQCAERNGIEIVSFRRGERKDERTQADLRRWTAGEGVLYTGRAQEARVLRTEQRHCQRPRKTGRFSTPVGAPIPLPLSFRWRRG